jgi:DNA-binding MarR family transcriptional regulator
VAPDVPADALGEAFGAVARRLRAASMAAFAAYDVTPSQVRAIRVLDAHGGVRSKELAEHLRIAPRSATEVVDALESKGLVSRSTDPTDRRATLVALTDRGRELSEEVRRLRGVESEKLFQRLTGTDRADLARILGKLSEE